MMASNVRDLELLLDLDGTIIELDDGNYFVKFEAHRVDTSPKIPHGIKYSLTLHNRQGERTMGFDNAHPIEIMQGRFVRRPIESDHWHYGPGDRVESYIFTNAGKLLEDFWREVEKLTGIEE